MLCSLRIIIHHLLHPARKLLQMNSITALLSRKHMDVSFDRALKQTMNSKLPSIPPDVPLSLYPNVMPNLISSLEQHGAILQLPSKPEFDLIKVTTNTISLEWKMVNQTAVSQDRTLTYSLHCYADVPAKLKVRVGSNKKLMSLISPESGFEDMSDHSTESKSTFISLPPTALGKRLPTEQDQAASQNSVSKLVEQTSDVATKVGEEQHKSEGHLVLKPTTGKTISSLLPEPIRLPQAIGSAGTETSASQQLPIASTKLRPKTEQSGQFHSGALLNLPPLIIKSSQAIATTRNGESETELLSVTTSGVFADSEDDTTPSSKQDFERRMSTVDEERIADAARRRSRVSRTDSSSELSTTCTSEELSVNEHVNLGRLCSGFAFEEIFYGEQSSFHYSGLVAGASYYFRVRCHNAAGWGPWSDTVKCMTTLN